MKALLFTNLFPTSPDSTRGLFTRQIADELARLCTLTVAVPLPWFPSNAFTRRLMPGYSAQFSDVIGSRAWPGYEAHYPRYVMLPKISESMHAQLLRFGVQRTIAQWHRRQAFDVINAHWLYPDGVAAAAIGRALGIPVVLTALGCDVNEFLGDRAKAPAILAAVHSAAALTTVSAQLKQGLVSAGIPAGKITVIANGVDTARFRPRERASCRASLQLPADAPLVVCVSRLSDEKGVAHLIEAMRRVHSAKPRATLALVGDGPLRSELEAAVAAANLTAAVRFAGNVPHPAVAEWIGAADVVCIPSLREGHPNAAMEALAGGRPLVASAVGALPGLVKPSVGTLVAPADAAALAAALTDALTRPWDANQIAASVAGASWARAAAEYVAVLSAAARSAAPGLEKLRAAG